MFKKFNPLVLKLVVLFVLLLLSGIPRSYVDWIIADRKAHEAVAVESVVNGWAAKHSFGRVEAAIPYTYETESKDEKGKLVKTTMSEVATVTPTLVKIDIRDKFETRKRGIFEIAIYKADVAIEGEIVIPKDVAPRLKNEVWSEWDQQLIFGFSDARAISEFSFELDGQRLPLRRVADGLALKLKDRVFTPGQKLRFKLNAKLNGYDGIYLASTADDFEVSINSAWPHPSFVGQLPQEQSIGKDGFTARWKIIQASSDQTINVSYIEPVDIYTRSERALKYGFLITLLCLSVLFLMETLASTYIQGMQYLLMTLPLTCFYILLIALAEHIGFSISYAAASAAVVGLIFIYFRGIGASLKQSLGLGATLSAVYGLIHTMLSSEDYALLIGAISLFLCLAAFMLLTRKLDWSKHIGKSPENVHA